MIIHKWQKSLHPIYRNEIYICSRCKQWCFTQSTESRCERYPLTNNQLKRLRIGRNFWDAEIEDLNQCNHLNIIQKYCENIPKMFEKGFGLFLWGSNGTGKTHTISIILKEVVRCGFTGLLIMPSEYINAIITKIPFDKDELFTQRCETVDFLVLDDFGKEYSKNGWTESNIEKLLRIRSKENRITCITTNYNEKEFSQKMGPSIASLALEILYPINIIGSDRRHLKYNKNLSILSTL